MNMIFVKKIKKQSSKIPILGPRMPYLIPRMAQFRCTWEENLFNFLHLATWRSLTHCSNQTNIQNWPSCQILSLNGSMVIEEKTLGSVMTVVEFQVKFNRFLHPNELPQKIFWYLVRQLDWGLSKIGHFQLLKSIF